MNLSKKIILSLLGSIFFMASINIVGFYFVYNYNILEYIDKKKSEKNFITIEIINDIIKEQTLEEIDNIFNDIELQLFDLIKKNDGKIPLNSQQNINLVINYLTKAGVTPKYIEKVIPENYLNKFITNIKNKQTAEYQLFSNIVNIMIYINIVAVLILIIGIIIFSKIIFLPIKIIAEKIKKIKIGKKFTKLNYEKNDEIGLLVKAINGLNENLTVQENIRNIMLADISHELKTPISSIQCYLEGIKDDIIKLDNRTLDEIITEMQRLIKLVNLIMEFENFENGKFLSEKKEINLLKITKVIVNHFGEKLKINNQQIKINGEEFLYLSDKDNFIQILQNIISNFINYSGKNTTLNINFYKNKIQFK
ncbi:MAG: hypothetical protein NWP80_01465, partial [Candidatus Gracilibacteria bacterium]|nr:hypothetical protein [Candidatus Gracilibacteria bacterium]